MDPKRQIFHYLLGGLCAAVILLSDSVVAYSTDSGETGFLTILNHSHPIRADSGEDALTDKLMICPLVMREDNVLLSPEDDLCDTEIPEPNILIDKADDPGIRELEQGAILFRSNIDSTGAQSSTHALPRIELNPNPALVVFHDSKRTDKLFYGMITITIRW